MQIGTKVTYTQKGYASDFLVKINNKYVNVPQRKAIKEEEYTQRKGIVTNIEKAKCGLVTYTVKWEDVGGYWEDDTSYVYREDIQEIEEEVVEEEVVEETSYIDTYVQFEKLTDYYTFGRGMVVYLHYKYERIDKRFSCVVEAMQHAIDIEKSR